MKFNFLARIFVIISCLSNTSFGQLYKDYKDAINMEYKDSVSFIWLDSMDSNASINLSLFPYLEGLSIYKWKGSYNFLNNITIKKLYISFSKGVSNIDFSIFNELEELEIPNNKLTEFPLSITQLKKLKKLRIGDQYYDAYPLCEDDSYFQTQNKIVSLPESISELIELENLDISFNPIVNFPDSFSKLEKLQFLDISKTDIQDLPVYLIESRKEKLTLRYFTGNENHFSKKTKSYLSKQEFRSSSTTKCIKNGRFKRVSKSLS